jgi:hypothetical protein
VNGLAYSQNCKLSDGKPLLDGPADETELWVGFHFELKKGGLQSQDKKMNYIQCLNIKLCNDGEICQSAGY